MLQLGQVRCADLHADAGDTDGACEKPELLWKKGEAEMVKLSASPTPQNFAVSEAPQVRPTAGLAQSIKENGASPLV